MRQSILVGIVLAMGAITTAEAGESSFIQRPTRIKGCVAIVDEVRKGTIEPTQWLEQNKEEFKDLELELKSRNYPPAKAKDFMMGMAISLCMEQKGFTNKCVVSRGEDGDVQMMATANVYACWTRNDRSEAVIPPPPPVIEPHWPPQEPQRPQLPAMSPADQAQFNEDMAILTRPPISVYPYSNQGERFASCTSHWQSLHYNRPPEVRQILYAVRVARCMYRTGFAVRLCPALDFGSMLQPRCYARF